MSDLASLRPSLSVVIDAVKVELPPPSLANLVEVQKWLNQQPSPRERMRKLLDDLPADTPQEVRVALAKEAVERSAYWPPKFGTMEAGTLLAEMEGILVLAAAMIRTGQPALTFERALELAGKLSPDQMGQIMDVAFGKPDAEAEAPDPKAPSGGSAPGSTPPTPSTGP